MQEWEFIKENLGHTAYYRLSPGKGGAGTFAKPEAGLGFCNCPVMRQSLLNLVLLGV